MTSTFGSLLRRAGLVCMVAALSGCGYTYHFQNSAGARGEEHNKWASYFLFGIVGHYEVDVKEFCPTGVYEITTGNNFLTWLVKGVTLGIYAPRKVNIWCDAEPQKTAFEVEFDRQGAPVRVTKRVASSTLTGDVKAMGDGRYGVLLHEGGAL